jgi:hypothetical protein
MSSFPQFTLVKNSETTEGVCRGCGTYCPLPLTVAYPDKAGHFCSILCWYGWELRSRTGGEAA